MSAIAGTYHFYQEPVNEEESLMLVQALRAYQSDQVNALSLGSVLLGCACQWITPESAHETLPRYDDDLHLAITADAILDNRCELFQMLGIDRSRRENVTDSELIALAYRKWGEQSPRYLIGDFAFMIWDEKKSFMFGARDMLGSRTLYYHKSAKQFAFCTAITPLLASVKKQINEQWLAEYLAIPHMYDVADYGSTVYQSVHQVPPGYSIKVFNDQLQLSRYGAIANGEALRLKSDDEYIEAFRDVFQTAIDSKIRSYRHVGAMLSGGLDSGSVVSFAVKALSNNGKKLRAFSSVPPSDFVDFTRRDTVADETPYIQATVNHVGDLEHQFMDFPGRTPVTEMDEWLSILESPYKFFENTMYIRGIHEEAQRQGVTVLLTGDKGNNTISWGDAADYYISLLRKLRWLRFYQESSMFARRMEVGRSRVIKTIGKYAFPFLTNSPFYKHPVEPELPFMIDPEFARKTAVMERLKRVPYDTGLTGAAVNAEQARTQYFQNLAILSMLGTVSTKLSLRYGVTERDPTSDLRVIRFCLSLPIEQFVWKGMDRALIRRATEKELPDAVRLNLKVRGRQGVDWLHRMSSSWKSFRNELIEACRDPDISSYLNVKNISDALSRTEVTPQPEAVYDNDTRGLMRSLIVYRFIRKMRS